MPTGAWLHTLLIIILAIMFISNLFDSNRQTKQGMLMSLLLLCELVLCLFNGLAFILHGVLRYEQFYKLACACLGIEGVALALFSLYFNSMMSDSSVIPRWMDHTIAVLCTVYAAAYFLSYFFPIAFYVDNATYHASPLALAGFLIALLVYILLFAKITIARKQLSKGEFFVLFSYVCFPSIIMLIQLFSGWDIIQFTTPILMCYVYISFHVARGKRLAIMEKELTDARVKLMISQIQPHFINNTLYNIKALCETDPERASALVDRFSVYLRSNLQYLTTENLIPFTEEINYLENYIAIEQERFDNINVVWQLDITDFMIPPMSLQPLVENAIKYGLRQKEDGGTVTITAADAGDKIVILIMDDGVGFDAEAQQDTSRVHIGIQNTRSRIEKLCNGTIEVESTPSVGTSVTITIPKERMSEK